MTQNKDWEKRFEKLYGTREETCRIVLKTPQARLALVDHYDQLKDFISQLLQATESRMRQEINKDIKGGLPRLRKHIEAEVRQEIAEKMPEVKTEFYSKGYYEGLKACPASYQKGREDLRKEVDNNIEQLRQWLNELPVTSWEITQWLFPDNKSCPKEVITKGKNKK